MAAAAVWLQTASAASVVAVLVDSGGRPVANAVVALLPPVASAPPVAGARVALDQVNKQFVPHVLAIRTGTTVYFPNSDNIRHQVYSFSDAKRFELKLYAGKAATPVLFDQPGVVVLGCNIHDWMSAYVYIVDTPYFAVTDPEGHASISAPPGSYAVKIWHPRLARGREPLSSALQVAHETETLRQTLALAAVDDSDGMPPSANPGH